MSGNKFCGICPKGGETRALVVGNFDRKTSATRAWKRSEKVGKYESLSGVVDSW